MSTLSLGIEITGRSNYCRLNPGDWELRLGEWTITLMWGCEAHLGGLFVAKGGSEHHWTWAELRSLIAGRS